MISFILPLALPAFILGWAQEQEPLEGLEGPFDTSSEMIATTFAEQGIRLDIERGLIEIDAFICQREEVLEYLLVDEERGKTHESLFYSRDVSAESLNTAMLLLGVQAGENTLIEPIEPQPTPEEIQNGAETLRVTPARGSGFYLYASWEIQLPDGAKQTVTYRAEDLVLNLRREQTYQRAKWVYLGSRFMKPHSKAKEMFAASAMGNFISLVYFSPANHLLMGADADAHNQSIWFPNLYLLPEIDTPVRLLFSTKRLEQSVPTLTANNE